MVKQDAMSKESEQQLKAAADAAALIKTTAEQTATALNIQFMQKDILEIKTTLKELSQKDNIYVQKEDFTFWRNLLVSGMLLTVALASIASFLTK